MSVASSFVDATRGLFKRAPSSSTARAESKLVSGGTGNLGGQINLKPATTYASPKSATTAAAKTGSANVPGAVIAPATGTSFSLAPYRTAGKVAGSAAVVGAGIGALGYLTAKGVGVAAAEIGKPRDLRTYEGWTDALNDRVDVVERQQAMDAQTVSDPGMGTQAFGGMATGAPEQNGSGSSLPLLLGLGAIAAVGVYALRKKKK